MGIQIIILSKLKYNKNLINKVVACKLKKINNNSIIDVKTIN